MRVTVNIDTENAAAWGEGAGLEASRLLAKVQSACITGGHRSGPLLDSNGNTVGRYSIDIPLQPDLDMEARYAVDGYDGIAFYLRGYVEAPDEDTDWTGELATDYENVRAVMVGDDREHIVSVDDLTPLDDDDYCGQCGQIGCGHDGRER